VRNINDLKADCEPANNRIMLMDGQASYRNAQMGGLCRAVHHAVVETFRLAVKVNRDL
jgi:hypothetical protein